MRRRKSFLRTNLPFYNFVAVSELAEIENIALIVAQDKEKKNP